MTSTADATDLDVRETLLAAAAERRQADRSEARLLALTIHQVHLHPVGHDTPVASWGDKLLTTPDADDAIVDHLAGAGTPKVAEQAVEELAAALDVSYRSGCGLVADALELRYRLPRLWALVQAGSLQAWKARQVASHTRALSRAAVDFVDRQIALHCGERNRIPGNLAALVHEALIVHDPETAQGREEAALQHRDVRFEYDSSDSTSTARLTATMETLEALDLDATISDLANQMCRLGDQSPLGTRRASALGLLAHPQRALDLFGRPGADDSSHSDTGGRESSPRKDLGIIGGTLYVHVTGDDLRSGAEDGRQGPGSVEKVGTTTLDLLRTWLQRVNGITLRPVLDMNRTDAVDAHDPPTWMRDLVILRDAHCVFPGCNIDARRCDLDHIEPYIDPDEGGPPGQTSPVNLACLCRRHHRLKTFAAWDYQRAGPGTYHWTNPYGVTYESRPTPKH